MAKTVAVLDYGSGNIRSTQRALEYAGAEVIITADPKVAVAQDGLVVSGVGSYATCMNGLRQVYGPRVIGERLAGGRPVLGICVGMQVFFDSGTEHGATTPGCGEWPGDVDKLQAEILPHMGWNTVDLPADSRMFAGLMESDRFYFAHSYAARTWDLETEGRTVPPLVAWAEHGGDRFVAAVENGPLWATQFHPEKSGAAGARLLRNWLHSF